MQKYEQVIAVSQKSSLQTGLTAQYNTVFSPLDL